VPPFTVQIPGSTIDRVGVKPADIKRIVDDFRNKITPAKVKQIAEIYGGDAMQHYGADFFRDYEGVTETTMDHLLLPGVIKDGKIDGTHDEDQFLAILHGNGETLNIEVCPTNSDVTLYKYKLYRKSPGGTVMHPPQLSTSKVTPEKTVIKGLVSDRGKWKTFGNEAADDAIRRKMLSVDGYSSRGVAKDGTEFEMYYRTDRIQTFYPVW